MNRMRMVRLAGTAVLAAGLAVAFVPATGASPITDTASGLNAAMQRDLGLTADQVSTRIAQEATARSADAALSGQLGGSFAGSWFDSSTGKLVVAVTDASRTQQVEAAGASARVVQHSLAQLDVAKTGLDGASATAPKTVTGWRVDVTSNSVVASVLNNDAAGLAWAASHGARTESVSEAPQTYATLIGGQAIRTSGARCSLGFNARNSAGTRFVITAGHCTNIGTNWTAVDGSTLGVRQFSSFPGDDFGSIRVTNGTSTALVDRFSSGSDVTVAGSAQAPVNGSICRSGSTTGWHCGIVQAYNQTVNYPQGTVFGLVRTTVCAEPGDSGGSFVSPNGSTRVQAQGVTSGGSGNCSSGGTTFHQPVNEALSRLGLSLFTG
jgi:streptogrisin C